MVIVRSYVKLPEGTWKCGKSPEKDLPQERTESSDQDEFLALGFCSGRIETSWGPKDWGYSSSSGKE